MSNERWSYSCGDAMAMVFFRSDAIPMFYATRYHRFSCNLSLDLNITDDIFQCYGFPQFLVGFLDFPRYFPGICLIFMVFEGIFMVFIVEAKPSSTMRCFC